MIERSDEGVELNKLVQFCLLTLLACCLWSCARGQQFQVSPQKGAAQTNSYPSFNIKPKAATAQFTPDETNALMNQLRNDSKLAKRNPSASGTNANNARIDARQEAEKALREIEQSGKKQ